MTKASKKIREILSRIRKKNALMLSFGYDVTKASRFVMSKIPSLKGKILEIGTGKGRFLRELSKKADDIVTVDLSREEQKVAKLLMPTVKSSAKIRFVIQDAANLAKFKGKSFDLAVFVNAAHHMDNPFAVLDEIIRVVKDNGFIVISDFTPEGFRIIERVHKAEKGETHPRNPIGLNHLSARLKTSGWHITRHRSFHQDVIAAKKD